MHIASLSVITIPPGRGYRRCWDPGCRGVGSSVCPGGGGIDLKVGLVDISGSQKGERCLLQGIKETLALKRSLLGAAAIAFFLDTDTSGKFDTVKKLTQ